MPFAATVTLDVERRCKDYLWIFSKLSSCVFFPNGAVKLNFYSSFEISGWRVSIFLYKFVDMSDGQGYIVHPSVAPGV